MSDGPNILFCDIETTPLEVYTWGLYNQNALEVKTPSRLLGVSFAMNDNPVQWTPAARNGSDTALVQAVWRLFDKADWIVAHNGDRFDIKRLNTYFLVNGHGPPSPYQQIDSLKMWNSKFAQAEGASLKYTARKLKLQDKLTNSGIKLWLDCMANVPEAWAEMGAYAIQDTVTLRELYYELRPWMVRGPNMGHFREGLACRNCGSLDLVKRGKHRTNASVFQTYQCKECGGYSRSPFREDTAGLR